METEIIDMCWVFRDSSNVPKNNKQAIRSAIFRRLPDSKYFTGVVYFDLSDTWTGATTLEDITFIVDFRRMELVAWSDSLPRCQPRYLSSHEVVDLLDKSKQASVENRGI